jgi:hypothetical protein
MGSVKADRQNKSLKAFRRDLFDRISLRHICMRRERMSCLSNRNISERYCRYQASSFFPLSRETRLAFNNGESSVYVKVC